MIFNRKVIHNRRAQLLINQESLAKVSYIHDLGIEILQDLVQGIDISCLKQILIIGDRVGVVTTLLKKVVSPAANILGCDDLTVVDLPTENFDLIISFFDIHWLNDLEMHIQIYREIMSDQGVIVGSFIGKDSLANLKDKLVQLETKLTGKHYLHTSNLIDARCFATLLQRYRYRNIMITIEGLNVKYANFIQLLRDLKYMGENNALVAAEPYRIPKQVYQSILDDKTPFDEQFKIISFIATKNINLNIKKMDELCHNN